MNGLKSGWKTAMLDIRPGTPAHIIEKQINEEISRIQDDAYGAGFLMDVKSLDISTRNNSEIVIILYRLNDDPGFHPPM